MCPIIGIQIRNWFRFSIDHKSEAPDGEGGAGEVEGNVAFFLLSTFDKKPRYFN